MSTSSSGIMDDDKDKLNILMRAICKEEFWQNRMTNLKTGEDLKQKIREILSHILTELETANMKNNLIKKSEVYDFVERLDDNNVLEEWKAMVQDCVAKNDWTALISHRMCI
jgi:enamine deaminase RidA (YjgF/YER057c/UK114 family)